MQKTKVLFKDLGLVDYKKTWDYQEKLLQENAAIKSTLKAKTPDADHEMILDGPGLDTTNYLFFVEHPPVYTLGKSGDKKNVLLTDAQLAEKDILFFHTNRGGDITFHGPGQVVGYPILDLEKFDTDIGKYLRRLEEVIICTLNEYGIIGERSAGETGVWIEPAIPGRARKICAIGVRCSRWITMHGFALNVNTDLSYFNHIIPCGISDKQVTSIENELGESQDIDRVKDTLIKNFEKVFETEVIISADDLETVR